MSTRRSYTGDKEATSVTLSSSTLAATRTYARAMNHPGGVSGVVEEALRSYFVTHSDQALLAANTYAVSTPQEAEATTLRSFIESLGGDDGENSHEA